MPLRPIATAVARREAVEGCGVNQDKLNAASSYQPGALHLAKGARNDLANGADRGCESLGASLDDQFVAAPLSQVEQMAGEPRPDREQQAARERVLGGQELGRRGTETTHARRQGCC